VLGLIFLKFASDKFENRRKELIEKGKEKYLEVKGFYNMKNIFFLPGESRWSCIMENAKQDDIALKIDTALHEYVIMPNHFHAIIEILFSKKKSGGKTGELPFASTDKIWQHNYYEHIIRHEKAYYFKLYFKQSH